MENNNNYRRLSENEIAQLISQSCIADDWSTVEVAPGFTTDYICHTRFSGSVRIGIQQKEFILAGGLKKHAGLRHVTLHNCTIGDNVLIENVANYIANYTIGEDSFIQNVNLLLVEGVSSFGNGTLVSVLNETGGREVPIYNELSAQIAYILALYRHRPQVTQKVTEMITRYVSERTSDRGVIGKGVKIVNTGTIKNVFIGDAACIDGASGLSNGTINSNSFDPVFVGHNVIADDFIFASGAHVADGTVIIRSFIGQGTHLSHLFSAHDSLFFCNCQGENGEACAIFAGPYTVSMHKSSLLIAGMFSFLNAGSGSNQSNHMYKLGPIHQGIAERGSKTTSDSYILWPAKIGAFSLVMGRHVRHSDTSNIPFSYLIEKNDTSYLVPGVNLRSVGTIRDAQKWPKRDKRKDPCKLDMVNFNLLSPYTIQKMLTAIDILHELQRTSGENSEEYSFQSARIKNSSLNKGLALYSKAINKFLGNSIITRLKDASFKNDEELRSVLFTDVSKGREEWLDLAGMLAPRSSIEKLLKDIEEGHITMLSQIQQTIEDIHSDYYQLEWRWACVVMQEWYGIPLDKITIDDIIHIVEIWKDSVVSLDKMLYEDAKKEFSITSKTGFGMDGTAHEKEIDFERVRGDFESNPFVEAVKEHIVKKTALGDRVIAQLKSIIKQ